MLWLYDQDARLLGGREERLPEGLVPGGQVSGAVELEIVGALGGFSG